MKTSNYGASPMKELKIIYSKEGTIFGRHLPVRIVLALLHTCANGSNHTIFPLHLHVLILLHVVAESYKNGPLSNLQVKSAR